MLKQACGRIINISSIIADTGYSGLSVYAASKSGLVGFPKSLARELGKRNITVNCVAPGFMQTGMTKTINRDKFNKIQNRSPLGLPTTEQVAESVVFLLSNAGTKITGTVITVDGGSTA